jgi:azurin
MRRTFCVIALALLALGAHAQDCSLVVEGNDQIQYVQKELRISKGCSEVTVTLKHIGQLASNIMGHNWVLSKTADYQALAQAGQGAGAPDYLPAGDTRIIAATKIIGGGEETTITFSTAGLEPGGDYTYFCSFPGHFVLMNGKFIVE